MGKRAKRATIEGMKEVIRILHLNDLHSHFEQYPQVKACFEDQSQGEAEVIKLDLGDNVDKSHPLSDATSGRFNVALMNELDMDYVTIGNNEGIGLGKAELDRLYDEARFKPVIGNLKTKEGRQPQWASPYLIHRTRGGHTIAFLAYTFPYVLTYTPNDWVVQDPMEALGRDLERLEVKAADAIVVMSHLGITYDEQIAETFPQVDLVIGSHTHHLLEEGKLVNGVYLAAADRYGHYVGRIDLTLGDGQVDECQIEAIPTKGYAMDEEDKVFIQAMRDEGYRRLARDRVADLGRYLTFEESFDRVLEAVCQETGSQVTLLNTGLLLDAFGPSVSMADLQACLPHQMRLIKLELTGPELATICQEVLTKAQLLEHQAIKGMGFRGKEFGKVITHGFTYKNQEIVYNDKVVGPDETLTLVLVDQYYFAPYFPTIKAQEVELLFPDLLREVVAKYLRKYG